MEATQNGSVTGQTGHLQKTQHDQRLSCILAPWFLSCHCLLSRILSRSVTFKPPPNFKISLLNIPSAEWPQSSTHVFENTNNYFLRYILCVILVSYSMEGYTHFTGQKIKPWLFSKLCIVVIKTRQAPEKIHMLKPDVSTTLESLQWHDNEFVVFPPNHKRAEDLSDIHFVASTVHSTPPSSWWSAARRCHQFRRCALCASHRTVGTSWISNSDSTQPCRPDLPYQMHGLPWGYPSGYADSPLLCSTCL